MLRHQFYFNKIQLVSSLCSPEPFQKRDVNKGPPLPGTQMHLPCFCFCFSSRNRAAHNYLLKSLIACTSGSSISLCEDISHDTLKCNKKQVFIFYTASLSFSCLPTPIPTDPCPYKQSFNDPPKTQPLQHPSTQQPMSPSVHIFIPSNHPSVHPPLHYTTHLLQSSSIHSCTLPLLHPSVHPIPPSVNHI